MQTIKVAVLRSSIIQRFPTKRYGDELAIITDSNQLTLNAKNLLVYPIATTT